jgi:hypothetical protein
LVVYLLSRLDRVEKFPAIALDVSARGLCAHAEAMSLRGKLVSAARHFSASYCSLRAKLSCETRDASSPLPLATLWPLSSYGLSHLKLAAPSHVTCLDSGRLGSSSSTLSLRVSLSMLALKESWSSAPWRNLSEKVSRVHLQMLQSDPTHAFAVLECMPDLVSRTRGLLD